MVKLSKPGHNPEYVSYLEQIDDENVLKALEALRLKAMGGSSKAKMNRVSQEAIPTSPTIEVSLLPVDTSGVPSKLSINETPLTPATLSSSSSNSTPPRKSRRKKSAAANGGLDLRARMAKSAPTSSKESSGTAEFVPKWKLQPLIKRRSVPTWELVTAAEEKFASEQEPAEGTVEELTKAGHVEGGGNDDGPLSSVAKQATADELSPTSQVEGSDSPQSTSTKEPMLAGEDVVSDDTVPSPEGITGSSNTTEVQGLGISTEGKALDERTSGKEKDLKIIADFMETKLSFNKPAADNTENRSAFSAFLSRLDCFSMVDPIIEPTTDFEDNFTYCSATDESDASNHNDIAELQNATNEKNTDGEKEAIEFLNEKGLDQIPRMISTLSKCNDMLAEGKSDPTHLEHISKMLCHMEYKLQDYGGYRRRNDRELPDSETDINHVFAQIDELKKLIFRIVEDFIDDHMVNPWNAEVSSLPSALSDGDTDSIPTATDTLEEPDDMSTLGEDSVAQPDTLEGKDVTVTIPPNPSSGHNYLPSLLASTLSLTSDMSTKRIENMSIASSKLQSGDTKFVSAELFVGNPTLMTVPPCSDSDDCVSTPPSQGLPPKKVDASCTTRKVRTTNKSYVMKNLSRLLSRPSKKHSSKKDELEDRNPSVTEEVIPTGKKNKDPVNSSLPPVDHKTNKLKSQPSPARRFFGSRQETKSQSVIDKKTSITLQEAVDNNGSAFTEIESVAHGLPRNGSFLAPSTCGSHSPTSVLILPELSHGDHELYAIESIVGSATPVM